MLLSLFPHANAYYTLFRMNRNIKIPNKAQIRCYSLAINEPHWGLTVSKTTGHTIPGDLEVILLSLV